MANPVDQAINNTMDSINTAGTKSFDLAGYMRDQMPGVKLSGVNPDGSAQVTYPTPDGGVKSSQFDVNKLVKDMGVDPMKVKVQYNTPDQALDDNPVGFVDGLQMALSDSKHQQSYLQGKYGQENVMKSGDGFVVNDKGAWKKADPGFLAKIASMAPEIGAYGVGEAGGAALGTALLGPLGTLPGAIAGGAILPALSTIVKQKGVEALGLRSEMDAQQAATTFGHEVVNNLVWNTFLHGMGTLGKVGTAPGVATVKAAMMAVDKDGLAAMGEKLLPGTSKMDWSTVVRSGEDAKAVQSGIKEMAAYGKTAANSVVKGPDPMTGKMVTTMKGFMEDSKTAAEKMYGDMWSSLEESGVTKAPVNIADTATKLKTDMIGMGLLDKDIEGNLFFNPTPKSQDAERVLQVFDPKSRNTIKQVFDQISNVAAQGGQVSFAKAKALIGGVDDILENSGFFKNGESSLSNNVRRSLGAFKQSLSNNIADGIKDQVVVRGGAAESALAYFKDVNSKYSQYRSVMNDFSLSNKFGGDIRQTSATLDRMLGEKGVGLEDNFMKLGSAVGKDAEPVLQQLQQMRAAKNLSPIYTPSTGVASLAREAITGGPRTWANRTAAATVERDASSFSKAWNDNLMTKIPAKGSSKALVEARARMSDYIKNLGPENKLALITSPIALRAMVDAVESTPQLQQTATQQMLKPVQQLLSPMQGQQGK
jgi:hypothetical protein